MNGPCIRVRVVGDPAPKGSMRAFVRGGRAVVTHDNGPRLDEWAALVDKAARAANVTPLAGPVAVLLDFYMPRPKGDYGSKGLRPSARPHPSVKPDIDKLARSTLDALTGVLFHDDGQVVDLWVRKHYADGQPRGCEIAVGAV